MKNVIQRLVISLTFIFSVVGPIKPLASSNILLDNSKKPLLLDTAQKPLQADIIPLPFNESFKNSTISSDWILGGNTILTGNGSIDPIDDGWLRLTGKTTYETGYIYYNKSIATNRGLTIDFDYASWGGNGADGMSFFLFDGSTPTFNPGGNGGSLGYSQRCGIVGLSHGYLGIGLDEFGNYSNPNECRYGGPGWTKDSIAIRGPGNGLAGTGISNYPYVVGSAVLTAGIDTPSVATRPLQTSNRYRHVTIIIEPVATANRITVKMTLGYGTTPVEVIPPTLMSFAPPASLKFGFIGSTGGNTNYHEIRNLGIKAQVLDLQATKTVTDVNGGNVKPGDTLQYSIALKNNSNYSLNGVAFNDPIPTNTTYVTNSLSLPFGSNLVSETPITAINNLTIPPLSQVNISYKVIINTPLDNGTIISNQGTFNFDSDGNGTNDTIINTDGDLVQSGSQPTIIGVQSGPEFSQTSKTVTLNDIDGDGAASPGDVLQYSIILNNIGNANSNDTVFTDSIPSKTTYNSGTAHASSGATPIYHSSTNTIEWAGDVHAGAQVTLSFSVTINLSGVQIRDVISNQGLVQYDSDNNGSLDDSHLTDGDLAQPGLQPTDIVVGGQVKGITIKTATDLNGGNLVPGDVIQYTISMQNLSNFDSNGMEFLDTIPNYTTFVANSVSAPTESTIISTSPTLDIKGFNIPARATINISFKVQVVSSVPAGISQISNQGLVYYDTNNDGINDGLDYSDGDTNIAGFQPTVLSLTAGPDFSTSSKVVQLYIDADGNLAVSPGDTLQYTIQLHNSGNMGASGIIMRDPLPTEISYVNGSLSTIPSSPSAGYNPSEKRIEWDGDNTVGSTVTLQFLTTINSPLSPGTVINNQGVINANGNSYLTDGDASQPGSQHTTVTLGGQPQGIAIKSATDLNGGNLVPGDIIRYDIVMNNQSAYDSMNMEFSDSIPNNCDYVPNSLNSPPGTTIISVTPLIRIKGINVYARSLVSLSFKVKVKDVVPAGVDSISNQGQIYYDSDGNGSNDSSQLTDGNTAISGNQPTVLSLLAGPNFSGSSKGVQLINDADNNGAISPGDALRYILTLNNDGNQDASGVALQDILPSQISFVPGSLSSSPASPSISYSAGKVQWSGNIAVGSNVIIRYSTTVNAGLLTGTEISNQGQITYGGVITNTDSDASQPGSQPTTVRLGGQPQGIAIKGATDLNGGNLEPGDIIQYSISMFNQSNYDSLNMEFTDTAPGNTKIIPSSIISPVGTTVSVTESNLDISCINVLANTQVILNFNVQVNNTLPSGVSEISNQGVVYYDSDGNGNNDSSQLTDGDLVTNGNQPTIFPIITGANFENSSKVVSLAVDSDNNGLVSPGDTLEYTIYLPNQGNANAVNAGLVDSIPEHTNYVPGSGSATIGIITYQDVDKKILWHGDIAAGVTVSIKFRVIADIGLNPSTIISNQGLVTMGVSNTPLVTTDGDLQTPGRQPTEAVIGGTVAGFAQKTAEDINGGSLQPGDTIRYHLKFKNTSTFPATGLEFVDSIPAHTTYVNGSLVPPIGPNVVIVSTTPILRITGIDVPALSELEFSFNVKVNTSIPAGIINIENQGLVNYDTNGDGINDASQFTDSDLVTAGNQITPLLLSNIFDPPSAYKTFDDRGYPSIVWRQVWINDGNASSEVVTITDDIPTGTTYVNNSLVCQSHGTSSVYSCSYNSSLDQIQFTGIIGSDPSASNETQANNEVIIQFETHIEPGTLTAQNQAHGFWDQNGNGVVDSNDPNVSLNQYVKSDNPNTSLPSDSTAWNYTINNFVMPKTGFAPGKQTTLAPQPSNKVYEDLSSMQIEIPRIGIRLPIVGIPFINNQWDLLWLSNQLGYLNGTAFPTWSGNSILTGHLVLPNGNPGPLFRLNELIYRDKIIIHAWDQDYVFEVREKSIINDTYNSIFKHKDVPWISLITCRDFNAKEGVYRSHLYVGAVLIKIN